MVTPENTLSFDFMKVGVTGLNCIDMLAYYAFLAFVLKDLMIF